MRDHKCTQEGCHAITARAGDRCTRHKKHKPLASAPAGISANLLPTWVAKGGDA